MIIRKEYRLMYLVGRVVFFSFWVQRSGREPEYVLRTWQSCQMVLVRNP